MGGDELHPYDRHAKYFQAHQCIRNVVEVAGAQFMMSANMSPLWLEGWERRTASPVQ